MHRTSILSAVALLLALGAAAAPLQAQRSDWQVRVVPGGGVFLPTRDLGTVRTPDFDVRGELTRGVAMGVSSLSAELASSSSRFELGRDRPFNSREYERRVQHDLTALLALRIPLL